MHPQYQKIASSPLGVSSDAYIYSAIPIEPPHKFLAISSDDSLSIFEVDSQTIKPISIKSNHHKGLTCIQTFTTPSGSQAYVTAGRDGHIRAFSWPNHSQLWDLTTPNGKSISALATHPSPDGLLLAAGTEHADEGLGDVAVYVWTLHPTAAPTLVRSYTESHTDTVTALHFAPAGAPRLLSASTDGLLHCFDLAAADEDDAVLVTFNNRAAVHHACLLTNDMVCAVGHDERVSFYSVREEPELGEAETKPGPWDLRALLGCDYAASVRPGAGGDSVIVAVGANKLETAVVPWVGLCTFRVGLELLKAPPEPRFEGEMWMRLEGAHGEEVVRGVCYDYAQEGQLRIVLTCGEDGTVGMWRPVEGAAVERREKSKKDKDKGDKAHRFKPY
ncbi:hypothetical protein FH972_021779 [Carpinus fangiana]|uniref:Anaphase-promoting complex subunit 4 WD40 domain-containing protein n=1 Tax=Carpinus fangiana TaxID=176857 RepID=A0A5N6KQC4_9ROSI|nr:hypothetical protein FH972_021779 [Carpinus fangiana]